MSEPASRRAQEGAVCIPGCAVLCCRFGLTCAGMLWPRRVADGAGVEVRRCGEEWHVGLALGRACAAHARASSFLRGGQRARRLFGPPEPRKVRDGEVGWMMGPRRFDGTDDELKFTRGYNTGGSTLR